MALFKATVRRSKNYNGIRLEQGMSVDFPSTHTNPMVMNGGKDLIDAFMRKYGIDIKKANAVSAIDIEVVKVK